MNIFTGVTLTNHQEKAFPERQKWYSEKKSMIALVEQERILASTNHDFDINYIITLKL